MDESSDDEINTKSNKNKSNLGKRTKRVAEEVVSDVKSELSFSNKSVKHEEPALPDSKGSNSKIIARN